MGGLNNYVFKSALIISFDILFNAIHYQLRNVMKQKLFYIFILSAILNFPLFAEDNLDSLFTLRTDRGIITSECRYTIHDLSPEWPKILFTGLSYSAIHAIPGDMIAVAIPEQDGRMHVYTVSYSDYINFLDDKISLTDFVRHIRKR
jgi:hypothetical protein